MVDAPQDTPHHTHRFYVRQVERVAQRLRDMADEVERATEPRATPYIDGSPRYGVMAEQVIHTIVWGVANCSLDGVIHAATLADMAEREGDGDA